MRYAYVCSLFRKHCSERPVQSCRRLRRNTGRGRTLRRHFHCLLNQRVGYELLYAECSLLTSSDVRFPGLQASTPLTKVSKLSRGYFTLAKSIFNIHTSPPGVALDSLSISNLRNVSSTFHDGGSASTFGKASENEKRVATTMTMMTTTGMTTREETRMPQGLPRREEPLKVDVPREVPQRLPSQKLFAPLDLAIPQSPKRMPASPTSRPPTNRSSPAHQQSPNPSLSSSQRQATQAQPHRQITAPSLLRELTTRLKRGIQAVLRTNRRNGSELPQSAGVDPQSQQQTAEEIGAGLQQPNRSQGNPLQLQTGAEGRPNRSLTRQILTSVVRRVRGLRGSSRHENGPA